MNEGSDQLDNRIQITEEDLHPHLKARMLQRGITSREIEQTVNDGWNASDAKTGTFGKVMVFPFHDEWEGRFYHEKEVTVYYRFVDDGLVLSKVKARYGENFPRGERG